MLRALVYIVPIALLIYALIDFSRSLPSERADIPTPAWVLLIVLLPVVGPLAWILVSRSRRSGEHVPSTAGPARPAPGGHPTSRPTPPRPSAPRRRPGAPAPDDDPDFLWRLEQQHRRRAQRDRRSTDHPDDGEPDGKNQGHDRRTGDAGPDEQT